MDWQRDVSEGSTQLAIFVTVFVFCVPADYAIMFSTNLNLYVGQLCLFKKYGISRFVSCSNNKIGLMLTAKGGYLHGPD